MESYGIEFIEGSIVVMTFGHVQIGPFEFSVQIVQEPDGNTRIYWKLNQ